ncbi:MAG: sulfotransferase family 2 domain-containing protein [Synechococcales bacterium]|nr:sulfotransferase family 2 domain-containing protein [Synechococcales bacterium]
MPHFISTTANYLITTNYKVMYSTMTNQTGLRLCPGRELMKITYARRLGLCAASHYLIVRNPYHRLISFYKNKFQTNPLKAAAPLPYSKWQHSQRIFFPFLNITRETPADEIKDKLLHVRFDQFVQILPSVYRLDGHLSPQYQVRFICHRGLRLGQIKFTAILKMEASEDLNYLSQDLHLDLSQKHNQTGTAHLSDYFTSDLLRIVNDLYFEDFSRYGYTLQS